VRGKAFWGADAALPGADDEEEVLPAFEGEEDEPVRTFGDEEDDEEFPRPAGYKKGRKRVAADEDEDEEDEDDESTKDLVGLLNAESYDADEDEEEDSDEYEGLREFEPDEEEAEDDSGSSGKKKRSEEW
jgi:hypothetical protein